MIMAIHKELSLIFVCGTLLAGTVFAQSVSKETYDFNYIGQPLADSLMQHSKETYVLFGCAYYPWARLSAIGPFQYLFLLNPLTFVSEAMRLAAQKLPIRCQFVTREGDLFEG